MRESSEGPESADPSTSMPVCSTDGAADGAADDEPGRGRWWVPGPRLGRIGGHVLAPVLGLLVAVTGVFVSRVTVPAGGIDLPVGIVLAVGGAAGLFEAARQLVGWIASLAAVSGWSVGFVAFLVPRSAGDVLVANDGYGAGYGLLGLGALGWGAYRAATRR